MIPITSAAGWVLLYMLWRRTVSPAATCASASPVHVLIESTRCTSFGSSVATDLQIVEPSRLSFVASTATPWPWRWPIAATTFPGTFTVQSQWVSEKLAGIAYSESPHWSMSSQTGVNVRTDSQDGRWVYLTWM